MTTTKQGGTPTPRTDAVTHGWVYNDTANVAKLTVVTRFAKTLETELATQSATIERLRKGLAPFAHPDLSKTLGGNIEGDASPVFGRDKAKLTLGDFRRAALALTASPAENADGKPLSNRQNLKVADEAVAAILKDIREKNDMIDAGETHGAEWAKREDDLGECQLILENMAKETDRLDCLL